MTVYVDEIVDYGAAALAKGLPAAQWAHLTADDRGELHAFARRLGLARRWFQDDRVGWHYDVTTGKRARALQLGAEAIDWRAMGQLMTQRRAEVDVDFDVAGVIHDLGEDGGCAADCSGCEVEPSPSQAEARTTEAAEGTPARWLAVVELAGGQCECTINVGRHQHRAFPGKRCPVQHEVNGGRLFVSAEDRVYCGGCFGRAVREALAATAPPAELPGQAATAADDDLRLF